MTKLNIVCALHAEAKVIIEHLKLTKDVNIKLFECYKNKEDNINLIISGIGHLNSAIATSFLASQDINQPQAFLNIGIVGCKSLSIGEVRLVNKLSMFDEKNKIYPKSNFIPSLNSAELITYPYSVKTLPDNAMVDMEGYGFYKAANKYSTQEHIQLIKVISDNHVDDQEKITVQFVENLFAKQINTILAVIKIMQTLLVSESEQELPQYLKLLETFIFSEQEKIILEKQINRANIFSVDINVLINKAQNKKVFLKELDKALSECY